MKTQQTVLDNLHNTDQRLQQLINLLFYGFNGQNLFCTVIDMNETMVFVNDTHYFLNDLLWPENVVGTNITTNMDKKDQAYGVNQTQIIVELFRNVLATKQSKAIYRIGQHRDGFNFLAKSLCLPIITADKELIGAYLISWCANPLHINTLLHNRFNPLSTQDTIKSINQVALSKREHQIIYLLLNNLSQYEVADLLALSRSTVQRIISEQLCPKFKINPISTTALLDAAHQLGYHLFFPPSLMSYRFMQESNDEIDITQFQANLAINA